MNKRKKIVLIIIISIIFLLLIGGTYAWYAWTTSSDDEIEVLAGIEAANIVYRESSNISGIRLKPTETKEEGIIKEITMRSTEDIYYTLTFDLYLDILSLPAGLKDASFKYSFYREDTLVKEGNFSEEYLNNNLVGCTTNNTNHIVLLDNEDITSDITKYKLYIWIDGNMNNPNTMQNLDFSFKLHAYGENAILYDKTLVTASVDGLYKGYSCDSSTSDCTLSFLGSDVNREEITSVTFVDNNNVPEEALGSTDVSQTEDKSIMLWYTKDTEKSTNTKNYYDVFIGAKYGVAYINDGTYLFYGLTNVESINFGDVVDTTPMTSMQRMFNNCTKLTTLNLSGFNTSNVISMHTAFSGCHELISLNLSGLDTSNVTNMRSLFNRCYKLKELDLSGFDTSNVTIMTAMFQECESLENVDLRSFDTSKVTDMSYMFNCCYKLKELDLSGFDTSNVTIMTAMFQRCDSIEKIDVSNFDTSKVTDIRNLFYGCGKLKELNLTSFDTSNVIEMQSLFYGCNSLESLDLSSFNTSKVTNMSNMFQESSNIITIYVSDLWNVSAVTASTDMFTGCTSLVGGSDTTYNASYIDKTYARVDGGTSSPGYFTYKAASA